MLSIFIFFLNDDVHLSKPHIVCLQYFSIIEGGFSDLGIGLFGLQKPKFQLFLTKKNYIDL
jgi:hypothetical protein